MSSETVGLRTRPLYETKKIGLGLGLVRCGLGLSGLVLYPAIFVLVSQVRYCFVKNDLVTLVVVTILKDTATFQVLFIISLFSNFSVLGTSLLWRSTVAFTYLKVKSAKYLCLLPVVLILVL